MHVDRDPAVGAAAPGGRHRLRIAVALAAATALAVLAVSAEVTRRHELYWYDVRQDYQYRFLPDRVVSLPVALSPDGFVFPATSVPWDTAVLRIEVHSTWTSRWFEPFITIEAGGTAARQFLERGADGVRYLIVPPTAVAGDPVRLRGDRVTWRSQQGELLLWSNAVPASPVVLVLAPHPDDAEIAAFGLYAAHRSFVATITAGNYVDRTYDHLAADAAGVDALRGRVRTWDSLAVPALGSVPPDRVVNLGYPGLSLERLHRQRHAEPVSEEGAPRLGDFRQGAVPQLLRDRPARATWPDLVEDLATLVDSVRPDILVAPHPVLDESSDHQFTTVALLEALDRVAADRALLFLYTNHHILAEYYPFGPSDAHVTLPPWFDGAFPFGSMYSFQLDAERQVNKLFALDAHHDLRAAPRRLDGGPTDRFLLRLRRAAEDIVRDPVSDYSYYRRAVRPNELFFVYAPHERRALSAAIGPTGRTARVTGQK